MPTLLSFISWYASSINNKTKITIILLKLSAASILLLVLTSNQTFNYQKTILKFNDWSNAGNVRKNGRVASFLYFHNKRINILSNMTRHEYVPIFDYFYRKTPSNKRNIHIIILESFVDPREIKQFTYNQSPVNDKLSPFLLNTKEFSIIETPVYGGGTAQTEFEILTGIPALAQIDSIEFNLFEGNPTSSFVKVLQRNGYYTMASIATEPVFYNSQLAYQGIGFTEINFLGENSYFEEQQDHYLFDGDLLSANISYVQEYLSHKGKTKPLLNYIVGMFGHVPFERNKKLRPDIISVSPKNKQLTEMSNQFYYRTKALGAFLQQLQKIDPLSIILITSDHLPPIFHNKALVYNHNLKFNIAILLNNFKATDISGKKTYEVSHILWNLLNDSANPLDTKSIFADTSEESFYYSYLLEAMGFQSIQDIK